MHKFEQEPSEKPEIMQGREAINTSINIDYLKDTTGSMAFRISRSGIDKQYKYLLYDDDTPTSLAKTPQETAEIVKILLFNHPKDKIYYSNVSEEDQKMIEGLLDIKNEKASLEIPKEIINGQEVIETWIYVEYIAGYFNISRTGKTEKWELLNDNNTPHQRVQQIDQVIKIIRELQEKHPHDNLKIRDEIPEKDKEKLLRRLKN